MLPFKKNKDSKPEIFFALEISEESVKAATWKVVDENIQVLKASETISVEDNRPESVLTAVDMAIATITEELEQDPTRVIFGLPQDWINDQGIKQEKRNLLKLLCSKLEMTPLGYVVIQDALVTYLKKEQGTPPNAIFIRFCKNELIVTLVQVGKILKQENVKKSNDIISDITEGISRFGKDTQLPAQIILYNSHTDFEDIKQQLLAASLEKQLPFLHIPRIDSLSSDTTVKAIAIAGGFEVAKTLGLTLPQTLPADNQVPSSQSTALTDESSSQDLPIQEENDQPSDEVQLPEGFVVGEDIEEISKNNQNLENNNNSLESPVSSQLINPNPILDNENLEVPENKIDTIKKPKFNPSKIIGKLKSIKIPIPSFPKKQKNEPIRPNLSIPKEISSPNRKKVKLIVVVSAILLLLISTAAIGYWYYYSKPKAQVILYISPKTINKEIQVALSTKAKEVDLQNFLIPAQFKEVSVQGQETIETTGTKKIGEKAKGKITIYNKTSSQKTFPKDTILVGPKNLRYVLGQEVTVASKSAQQTDGGEQVTYGSAETDILAGDIGETYNLDSEADFSFKDFASDKYSAKSKGVISGGSSSEIRIVSKQDQESARQALIKKLQVQASQKLESEIGPDNLVFDQNQEDELNDESFDKKLDSQANTLTIEGSIDAQDLMVKKNDFELIILKTLEASIPAEFVVSPNGLTHKVTTVSTEKDEDKEISKYLFTVSVQAKLMPKLNFADIKKAVVGKFPPQAEEYFKNLPNYSKTKISVNPALPGKLGTLPKKAENISITVEETQ
jgi:hypothetical protein